MKDFVRDNLWFSFCGLNCGLCPMKLAGHCPGCGGGEGKQSCKIAKCSIQHDKIEYCNHRAGVFGMEMEERVLAETKMSVMKRDWCPKCQAVQNVNITKTENTEKDKDGQEKKVITESYQ